jgi:hypothetical protein
MKMFTLIVLCLISCWFSKNLFAQCDVKISGKTCKGTVLTANADKSSLMKLEWQLNGKTVATFGSPLLGVTVAGGKGEGNDSDQLDEPNGVFVDVHNNVWVADTKNARIQEFKNGSKKGITIGKGLPNAPTFPTTLFVKGDGSVYVADYFESKVKLLTKGGHEWIDVAGQNNEMHLTRGVWVDKYGNVYATDIDNNRVLKYKPDSSVGKTVAGGNGYGSGLDQLAKPTSVVVDFQGNLYINDEDNQRVVKWAPGAKSGIVVAGNGALLDILPPGGSKNPIYASATTTTGLTGISQTVLYISDKAKNDVEMWPEGASSGVVVAGGNGRGDLPCQLNKPFANFICGNYLYVADRDNARIQRFDLTAGAINIQFTATEPGNYSVTATFNNECRVKSNIIQVTSGCEETSALSASNIADAVSAEINSSKAFAYPNPAKNSVTINFFSKQNGKYIFELSELSGKTLSHKEINALRGINNTALDVSSFAKGIYFITLINPDKTKQSIKLNKE